MEKSHSFFLSFSSSSLPSSTHLTRKRRKWVSFKKQTLTFFGANVNQTFSQENSSTNPLCGNVTYNFSKTFSFSKRESGAILDGASRGYSRVAERARKEPCRTGRASSGNRLAKAHAWKKSHLVRDVRRSDEALWEGIGKIGQLTGSRRKSESRHAPRVVGHPGHQRLRIGDAMIVPRVE